jgi:hypothetical protein
MLDIYTTAFRHVKSETAGSLSFSGNCLINLPEYEVSKLAAGTYYCILKAKDNSGRETKSAHVVLILLR